MTESYDLSMVFVSFSMVIFAVYAASGLSGRVAPARRRAMPLWIAGGAILAGVLVLALDIVGMQLMLSGTPLVYDLSLALWVLALAILGTAILSAALDPHARRTPAGQPSVALPRSNRELTHLALHDTLTQLPNRMLLEDRVEQSIGQARRNGDMFTLMFLDLDGFKKINDAFGHPVGDELLNQVGQRLTERLRATDTVARVGGDEFVVLAQADGVDDATRIAELIVELIREPFHVSEHELRLSTSLGIAMYPADGDDQQALLTNADAAMYHAKFNGKNAFTFFDPSMNAEAQDQRHLLQELRRALQEEQFELYYQPKFAGSGGQVVGAEALLRWHHPTQGLQAPSAFMALAEQSGLIVEIDRWVLSQACRQMGMWREEGHTQWCIAVNVSALQLSQPGFVDSVRGVLEHNAMPAGNLIIEITETMAMSDITVSSKVLHGLAELGVEVSLDNFGSRQTSLLNLKDLPIRELKTARGFVNDLDDGVRNTAIISAIVQFGQALGLRIVAEGIETPEQRSLLAGMNCDVMQGYLLGHPLPAKDFVGTLASREFA